MNELFKSKAFGIFLGAAALVVFAAVGFLAWQSYQAAKVTPTTPVTPLTKEEVKKADLGSELYEKATNPISDKLPETVAPVPNPVENIYKNPFQ